MLLCRKMINPNCFLLPNGLCIHSKCLVSSATVPYTVNDLTFVWGFYSLVWSTLGPGQWERRGLRWHRPPSGMRQTQVARKLASETQRNQKVGSQYHRHEAPETRKWRQPVLQTGSLVGDSRCGDMGDLSYVLDWLARCSCCFQTIQSR